MRYRNLAAAMVFVWVYACGGPGLAGAATIQDFGNPGTPYTLSNFSGPMAVTLYESSIGTFLHLADAAVGFTLNTVAFDRSDTGTFSKIVADFDFRMGLGSRADGMGFALLNTGTYGISGAGPQISEEVNLTGSLGVGFDIYDNSETGGDNHLSLHWNGSRLANFGLDKVTQLDLANYLFNHANIVVDFVAQDVTVTLTPNGGASFVAIDHYSIPSLAYYDNRVAFGARTGGSTANHDLDDVTVQYLAPMPPTVLFLGSGLICFLGWGRFRKN